MATASNNNHRIGSEFTASFYEDFSAYVENSSKAMASEDVDKLALLSIICHDLQLDGVAYQEKFFRLLKHPNALGTEIHRPRRNNPKPNLPEYVSRPRYSRLKPSSDPNFMFTWPSKTEPETYISIPMRYWSDEHREESIDLCCILYLLLADVAPSFSTFRPLEPAGQEAGHNFQIDCPCLLAYFYLSPKENQNNLKALLSEYVAMLQICFKENFCSSGESGNQQRPFFVPVTSSSGDPLPAIGSLATDSVQTGDSSQDCQQGNSDDFYIELGSGRTRNFSVKTFNHIDKPSWFSQDSEDKDKSFVSPPRKCKNGKRPSEPEQRRRHSPSANNILMLNCHCETCRSNAVVQLECAENSNEECPRNSAKNIVLHTYSEGDGQESHYVTSAWRLFQLRYALQGFNHQKFQKLAADGKKFRFFQKVIELFKRAVERLLSTGGFSKDAERACLRWEDLGEGD